MMQKILYFLGGSAREGGSAIHPADAIVRAGHVGRGLVKGGSLVGADNGLLPCGGDTRCQLHHRGEGKMAVQVDFCR